jgi:hypothetical protein
MRSRLSVSVDHVADDDDTDIARALLGSGRSSGSPGLAPAVIEQQPGSPQAQRVAGDLRLEVVEFTPW